MEHVKRMLTLQAEYAELLKTDVVDRTRSLEQVEQEYAVALSDSMQYLAPAHSMGEMSIDY
ncbi:hypothetical protein ACFRJ8_14635 [Arthrobacter sp. NPDC056886]|uniref:hypothetical protein n=1 Tax=Arthrobacter sp. NPDC056886 TaxID=3345960 RepID=UPI003671F4D2